MQFSVSWLRTFVDSGLDNDALAHLLTMSGLEVEDVAPVAPAFEHIVVARVLETAKHPDADRLTVCKVDVGTGEALTIVCGAPNVAAGIKVPCALVGAVLPPAEEGGVPFQIKLAKMRGVESQGMLCSARELKISDEHGGLLILDDSAVVGRSVREVLDLDDCLMTLKLTPNRADCLSVLGIAREVAALTGAPLQAPSFTPVATNSDERLRVRVDAPDLCGRFSGRILRGLNARAATPEWMKQRLARSGQRSISALVDISNYVMLELGRPTHVFDLARIQGDIEVRWGRPGESLKLLNGNTVSLDAGVGVIAAGDQVESLAGIMGGDATAVSLETTDIYLEAAFWWPQAIQGRARRFNFSTDAAHRFERGVDYATTVDHIEYISRLILEVCGTSASRVGPVDDQILDLPLRAAVRMRAARAVRVIGVEISNEEIAGIFQRLGFATEYVDGVFVVTPPTYRFDIQIEEDLIEEVARCHGYEKIPANLPAARHVMHSEPESQRSVHSLRHTLAARDYHEVINFSFVDESWEKELAGNDNPIRLLNPIASQMSVMRSTLIGGLLANVRYNLNRKTERVRVFELGKVFRRDAGVPDSGLTIKGYDQPLMMAALAYGTAAEEQWGVPARPVDFFDVKADLEALFAPLRPRFVKDTHVALHPGRSARIELDGRVVGWIGELHPRWQQRHELPQTPVLFEVEAAALQQLPLPQPSEVSKYPTVVRDLAFVVDAGIEVQRLFDEFETLRNENDAMQLIRSVALFDEYRGKGLKDNEKSLAFRFRLQDTQQTLNDATVESLMRLLTMRLQDQYGARLRS
jgi:phenylalanyl-tRNA synthetase beta chain